MRLHTVLLLPIFASLTTASFFSDTLRSLRQNNFSKFVKEAPRNLINDLENDEQQAGEAVCDILAGNFPALLQDVTSSLSSEAKSELNSLVDFVGELPKLAPEILGDLEQDADDVVSVIGELVTNPGAAITVIVGGVESVVDDIWGEIETVGGKIITGIECIFDNCPTAAVSTPAEILALRSSCLSISAAAATAPTLTTTYPAEPTTTIAATTYAAALTTTIVVATVTSQELVALSSETSVKATFPTTFLKSTTAGKSEAAVASSTPHPTSNNSYEGWRVDLVWITAALVGTSFLMMVV